MSAFPNGNYFSHGRFPIYYQVDPNTKQQTPAYNTAQEPLYQCYPVEPTPPRTGFSLWNAAKETVKGVFRPIVPIFKHPVKSALAIAATVAVTSVAPVTVPIMVLAGLGIGGVQTFQGVRTAIREYRQGNYDASEKAFGQIGEGGFSVVSSLLGIRQAGAIAAEAKASRAALNATVTAAEKLKAVEDGIRAAQRVQSGSWVKAFRETVSIFSTEGLKTAATQLNPVRIAAIARGKIQALLAMFQKRPVVDMDAALQQAQHRLGISNADAPHYAPNIDELRASLNNPQGIQGAYVPESHSIHIEPDRWQALRKLLGPFGNGNPLNSLPKPIQRFLGNAYKHHTSATELATHEMTHARQFIQVRKMSIEHARQVVQSAFPNQSQEAIQQLLNSLSFKGKIGNAARHRAGEQYLLQVAEHHFKQQNLLQKFLSRPAYSYNQYQHKLFKSYMRAPYEIEARQAAAQALIADAAKKLKQAQGIYQNHKILKQYRAARIEAKLNQLLRKFNKLEKAGLIPQAANTEKQLASWAQIQNARTSTYNYLQHEQILQAQAQTTQKIIQTKELVKAVQAGQTGILTTIKNFVGGILSRIVRFFTPQGVKQAEQQFHSLRPAYVAVNGYINREA